MSTPSDALTPKPRKLINDLSQERVLEAAVDVGDGSGAWQNYKDMVGIYSWSWSNRSSWMYQPELPENVTWLNPTDG